MSRRSRCSSARLNLETLEVRETPSVSWYVSSGVLVLEGTSSNDKAQITTSPGYYFLFDNGSHVKTFRAYEISAGKVYFEGYDGADHFQNDTALKVHAEGGEGNDVLIGGWNNDSLYGENGEDVLMGRNGHDHLDAGNLDASSNRLYGGSGNDYLYGGGGQDLMYGGADHDWLNGYSGNDYLYGGTGYDRLMGGYGNDVLDGGVQDGYADRLEGGHDGDWFRRDLRWNGRTYVNVEVFGDYRSSERDRAFNNYA